MSSRELSKRSKRSMLCNILHPVNSWASKTSINKSHIETKLKIKLSQFNFRNRPSSQSDGLTELASWRHGITIRPSVYFLNKMNLQDKSLDNLINRKERKGKEAPSRVPVKWSVWGIDREHLSFLIHSLSMSSPSRSIYGPSITQRAPAS